MKRGSEESSPSRTRLGHGAHINFPLDLEVEILKKLPTNSLVRFQCVSKIWSSIISSHRDSIDSIVTRSLSQPPCDTIILCDKDDNQRFLSFTSCTCPRNTNSVSIPHGFRQYVRGLICCWSDISQEAAIYNPTTRQTFYLPEKKLEQTVFCYFGYDPVENQYKALLITINPKEMACCHVFTLGDPMAKQWRTIQDVVSHYLASSVVCVNGVIHYIASFNSSSQKNKLMSFDVRSEKFFHVEAPETLMMDYNSTLINYKGKLGFVSCKKGMEIWVMEDVNKGIQGWSMICFYEMDMEGLKGWHIRGATRGGEIIFDRMYYYPYVLRVLYYDPKRNSMRTIDLKYVDLGKLFWNLWTVPDLVENTMCLHQTFFFPSVYIIKDKNHRTLFGPKFTTKGL